MELVGNRGVHINGLAVLCPGTHLPHSGMLLGNIGTETSGNNKFTDVKVLGTFSIAAMHNIGSETTRYDMCYFMNRAGYSFAGDSVNRMGAVSDHQTLRASGSAMSFTNNAFVSCRFENDDTSGTYLDSVYLEGTNGWTFDPACYFLAFDGAGVRIYDHNGTYRTSNLKLAGLFETSYAPGLKHAVRVVIGVDGAITGLANIQMDVASTHAKTSIIRVETAAGANLTSGLVAMRDWKFDATDALHGATKIFDGAYIAFTGHITCRNGALINVADLLRGYGTITCDDPTVIPSTAANTKIAFTAFGENVFSGEGQKIVLGSGAAIGFQGGTHPSVRAMSANTDADLLLQAQGAGRIRFGSLTANADAPVTGYITIKDFSGTVRKLAVIT